MKRRRAKIATPSRPSREERDRIDAMANDLYDKLNPKPFEQINVGKAECIRRVDKQIEKPSL
jgi:hypothetical protein